MLDNMEIYEAAFSPFEYCRVTSSMVMRDSKSSLNLADEKLYCHSCSFGYLYCHVYLGSIKPSKFVFVSF